jgi:hypothetical protein
VFLIKRPRYQHKRSLKVDLYLGNTFFVVFVIYWIYNNYIANPDGLKPLAASIKFITGYLIELSLVDNIFVIAIIFSAFKIPQNTSIGFILGYSRGNRIQRL